MEPILSFSDQSRTTGAELLGDKGASCSGCLVVFAQVEDVCFKPPGHNSTLSSAARNEVG